MASTDTKRKSSFTLGNLKGLTLLILGALSISLWTGQLDRVLLSVPQLSFNRASDNYRLDPNFNKDAEPQDRFYDWTIERKRLAPDGVMRDMITVNGRSPGPTIEANVGDTITVRVKNRLPSNLTQEAFDRFSTQMTEVHSTKTDSQVALHWHGLSMRGNPQSDGAHGFTSCAYGPGSEHTYKFVLHEQDSGTHWWHSHVGMSRSDGLWGTLIVHSKKEREALKNARTLSSGTSSTNLDWDEEEIITLGDHYHSTGAEQLSWFMSRYSLGFEPVPESSLINGKNSFDCKRAVNPITECYEPGARLGGKHAELVFDKRKRYRLRIVNVGAVADQVFSIDAHTLTVIEADGTLIEPLTVHRLPIAPGQRYSVLLNPPTSLDVNSEIHQEFLLRSEMDPACFNIPNPALELEALAIVRYPGTRDPTKSSSGHRTNSAGLELRSRGLEISRSSSSSKVQVLPKSEPWKKIPEPGVTNEPCHDMEPSSLVPLVEDRAPEFDPELDTRVVISATLPKLDKHNLSPMGYLNRSTWRADPSMPLLQKYLQATDPNNEMGYDLNEPIKSKIHGAKQLVINPSISEKRVVELILNNRDEAPHPFHLHGHKFWVLETHESTFGWGTYEDQGQSANYDLSKAIKRDTLNVPTRGYAVLRWWADNPGVHAFHCHVLVHMASGMAMSFVDQPALLSNMSIPYEKCEV